MTPAEIVQKDMDKIKESMNFDARLKSALEAQRLKYRKRLLQYGKGHFADDMSGWRSCAKAVFGL